MSIFDRALLEAVLLGAACGPLSVWILAFRQTYAAESLAHAMLPGLALAATYGDELVVLREPRMGLTIQHHDHP